jgi:hypothetical protein
MTAGADPRARTLHWDGAWFSVVGARLAGWPDEDPWRAVDRGRRLAALVGVGHEIDLPGSPVVETAAEVARLVAVPWTAPATDSQAVVRAASAGERAAALHHRAAELGAAIRGVVTEQTAHAAEVAAQSAQRNAAAARARAADVCEHSAVTHEQAAVLHERLAYLGVEPARHRSRAASHWEAAHADWAASRDRPLPDDD